MAKTQESIADIVAAMRILGKLDEKSTDKIPRSLMALGLRTYADRIEAAWERIATPAEGMPPKRGADRGAHPETAKSCLGTGEVENRHTVQIGEMSGGGRAEAKHRTATAGADPEPAKSFVNAAAIREACANIAEYAKTAACHTEDAHLLGYLDQIERWAQSALAAPPHEAKWTASGEYEFACCSKCGHMQYAGWDSRAEQAEKIGDFHVLCKFCSNCGAQMKGGTDGSK